MDVVDNACYHCGLPVLTGEKFSAHVLGQDRVLCCLGCQAVAEAIVQNGLEDYYTFRTERPNTAEALIPEELRQLTLYDHPEVQKSFVFRVGDGVNKSISDTTLKQASLILEGVTCAACIWLNERHLKQLSGVRDVAFNYGSHRARISWDDSEIKLSEILAEIRKIGYHAHPFSAQQQDAIRQQTRKADLRRLAVAGISAAQVMMLAVALYAGMDIATAQFIRWFSLVMTIPAISYSAWPFYQAAWRGVVNRRIGMDVPITLGLFTGFSGSLWATVYGSGTVYYDTLTMLIFFLLATRFLERNAREKSVEAAENLLRLVPAMAVRMENQQQNLVPLVEINAGDLIVSKPGETIAADGLVEQGESSADESLLTGESRPLPKSVGSRVYAGSINYENPLYIRVTGVGENTMLAGISRLLDRAQAEKPRLAKFADLVAAYFTYGLLTLVLLIGFSWWWLDASRCLEIVLTVLVVSCPCALSLAAPAAFAAAGSHLVKRGVLLTRGHALETLSHVTHVVFDKTGTLTLGHPVLLKSEALDAIAMDECLKLASSLEQVSEHPLAQSFMEATKGQVLYAVENSSNIPGKGLSGYLNGQHYFLGNADLNPAVTQQCYMHAGSENPSAPAGSSIVWLSNAEHLLAAFILADKARPHAVELVNQLQQQQIKVSILSGDAASAVAYFAQELGIANWQASQSPEQKLQALKALQQQGEIVAMVGDGINDAPVLAGAQVSIAMGSGTQMARATGDVILLSENLQEIEHAIRISRFSIQVIRQNFAWALVYNLIALPFAAMGLLSPWMAAIGMSISSLVVVLNALRLR